MANFSSDLFFGLSVLFWMAETSQRATRSGQPSPPGTLSAYFFELSEQAEVKGWLKRGSSGEMRLSSTLEQRIIGTRDPERNWNHAWNGDWHWLTFDLPREQQKFRKRLLRYLRYEAFGCIQGSLWVTPFPPKRYAASLEQLEVGPRKLFLISGKPDSGYKQMDIVAAAWDWELIYQTYTDYEELLAGFSFVKEPTAMAKIFEQEAKAWRRVASVDPFLPKKCLPQHYPGIRLWEKRRKTLAAWAQNSSELL